MTIFAAVIQSHRTAIDTAEQWATNPDLMKNLNLDADIVQKYREANFRMLIEIQIRHFDR